MPSTNRRILLIVAASLLGCAHGAQEDPFTQRLDLFVGLQDPSEAAPGSLVTCDPEGPLVVESVAIAGGTARLRATTNIVGAAGEVDREVAQAYLWVLSSGRPEELVLSASFPGVNEWTLDFPIVNPVTSVSSVRTNGPPDLARSAVADGWAFRFDGFFGDLPLRMELSVPDPGLVVSLEGDRLEGSASMLLDLRVPFCCLGDNDNDSCAGLTQTTPDAWGDLNGDGAITREDLAMTILQRGNGQGDETALERFSRLVFSGIEVVR